MLHDLQCIVNGLVALAALDVHDRTDAAVVMLKLGLYSPAGDLRSVKFSMPCNRSFPNAESIAATHITLQLSG